MKISEEIQQELFEVGDEYQGFELAEIGDWVSEGKYEFQDIIVRYQNKFYLFRKSRSGSCFTDYNYFYDDECYEVEKREIVINRWMPKLITKKT